MDNSIYLFICIICTYLFVYPFILLLRYLLFPLQEWELEARLEIQKLNLSIYF